MTWAVQDRVNENGKLSKLFCLIPRGPNLHAVSDTPQNMILWGIRPGGTKSCGYQALQNNERDVYISLQTLVLRGQIPRLQSPVRYQTPQNKVLRGIKPRGTTFKYKYFRKLETEFKNILGWEFWGLYRVDLWKN